MSDNIQPAFWLEVKKEYIIENFDKMLAYLEQYNYNRDEDNGSFDTTFKCLHDFVYDIFDSTADSNLCSVAGYEGISENLLVRIVAAYLLVCHKTGVCDVVALSHLAGRLMLSGAVSTAESLNDMKRLQLCCLRRQRIAKFAFTWNSIRDEKSLALNIFAYALAKTEFVDDGDFGEMFYENKGLALISNSSLRIAPMNFNDYHRNGVAVQFSPCSEIEVCVDSKDRKRIDSFEKLTEYNTGLMFQQRGVKPSPVRSLKTYDDMSGADVLVRITRIDNNIHVCTVDKGYHIIESCVYVPQNMFCVDAGYLKEYLSVGRIIKVRIQHNDYFKFRLTEPFEDYYAEVAEDSVLSTMSAVFFKKYGAGLSWITSNGIVVNIRDNNDDETVQAAVDEGSPVAVKVLNTKVMPYNNKLVVNAEYAFSSYCEDDGLSAAEFTHDAVDCMIDGFLEKCESEYIPSDDGTMPERCDATGLIPLAHVLYYNSQQKYISTQERYENLIAAHMIALMCDDMKDALFIAHEMAFVSQLVNFAQGADARTLCLKHDALIDGNAVVKRREDIITILSTYEHDTQPGYISLNDDEDDVLPKISDLVKASNIMLHKINGQEINRIKKNITSVLGVADMFRHSEENATYYGEENDTLEFKSSVVFPPVNKRNDPNVPGEPQRQKWEILKAVCGFLNSMSGGEILIGVMDNGYSCGIKADIDYLYTNHMIPEPNTDRYIQYVKYAVDHAFCDKSGTASETLDITQMRVHYVSETSKENNKILRIQVAPYQFGIVEFADADSLPEGMSMAYQRSSNTTAPLNADTRRQLEADKLSERADEETQKVMNLQKARKEQKAVILKGYNSKSGKRDRNVEAYKILLARNAVICFDLEQKKLKEFKITRIDKVEITDKRWRNFNKRYNNLGVDLFDMMEGDKPGTNIVLKLGQLPYNLILEECNGAENSISPNKDEDRDVYPWVLSTKVFGMRGIGRFYMGLAHDIKIVEGEELKAYVREYISNINLD